MKELSNNARKLLLAVGECDKRDIGAHELCMTHDEFIYASDELRRELLLAHWKLSEVGVADNMGAKLERPSLTKQGETLFKLLQN